MSSAVRHSPITLHRSSGFTLIELLIVTVVIVSLMGIVFRLTGIAGSASKREKTVARMQRLENCLSGYYAAFGSYPPVPLQGVSRDIYRKVSNGIQSQESEKKSFKNSEWEAWSKVKVACLAQPVRAQYPSPGQIGNHSAGDRYKKFQEGVNELYNDGFYSKSVRNAVDGWKDANIIDLNQSPGYCNEYKETTSFNNLPLFRFGLMSFLLPRYRFMLDCTKGSNGKYQSTGFKPGAYRQWTDNNPLPARMNTGVPYESWNEFCKLYGDKDDWQIDLIPSQAACARWLPNLLATSDDKDIVAGAQITVFGMTIGNGHVVPSIEAPSSFQLWDAGGYREGSSSSGYPLYFITMYDGWDNDFYYYSPAPYQTYVLWSSGADGKTFPPWVDLTELSRDDYEVAILWMADDIKFMSTGK